MHHTRFMPGQPKGAGAVSVLISVWAENSIYCERKHFKVFIDDTYCLDEVKQILDTILACKPFQVGIDMWVRGEAWSYRGFSYTSPVYYRSGP